MSVETLAARSGWIRLTQHSFEKIIAIVNERVHLPVAFSFLSKGDTTEHECPGKDQQLDLNMLYEPGEEISRHFIGLNPW